MLDEPTCYSRQCRHYQGVKQPDGTELTEVNYCPAFPDGIPVEIAYGDNLHLRPLPGQENNIVFEPIKQ